MSTDVFPVTCTIGMRFINEKGDFATATIENMPGIPDKQLLLKQMAGSLLGVSVSLPGKWRIPTPSEFASHFAATEMGMRIAIMGPKQWSGFTAAEFDAAVEAAKIEAAKPDDEETDD